MERRWGAEEGRWGAGVVGVGELDGAGCWSDAEVEATEDKDDGDKLAKDGDRDPSMPRPPSEEGAALPDDASPASEERTSLTKVWCHTASASKGGGGGVRDSSCDPSRMSGDGSTEEESETAAEASEEAIEGNGPI